ncbi:unnamed protein product [Vitrella brassicaformis CCMP3155]|uniref:Uncharacterized protein n=1 Tax=Vitrella brassicaformis (strain CCMP3155) TaxID=1169540 RepID=A0A0G4G2V4_VITBC|nr:unnamed protein product [Vitrella brassicaformis CCMP3155]|eukprot:CEM22296.1 unnamed protein product [Vitrella brassicaformis CCMP3155]
MSHLLTVVFATCQLVVCHSLPPTEGAEATADAQTDNESLQKQLAELKDTWQAFQRTYTRLQNDMREVNGVRSRRTAAAGLPRFVQSRSRLDPAMLHREMLDMEESSVERERRLGKVERTVRNMAATAEWGKHIAAAKRHAAETQEAAAAAPPQPAAAPIEESSAKAHSIEQTHIEEETPPPPVGEKKSAVLSSALPLNAVSRIGDPLKVGAGSRFAQQKTRVEWDETRSPSAVSPGVPTVTAGASASVVDGGQTRKAGVYTEKSAEQ